MKRSLSMRTWSFISIFALVLVIVGVTPLHPNVAQAANNTNVRIHDVVVQRWVSAGNPPQCDDVAISYSGAQACINWKWDASTANPQAGDSFYLGLPSNFKLTDTVPYDLKATLPSGEKPKIGVCTPTQGQGDEGGKITCAFDEGLTQLLAAGNQNLTGDGWLTIRAERKDDSTGHEFDLNGTKTVIPNPGNAPIPPASSGTVYETKKPYKFGDSIVSTTESINWYVGFTSDELAAKAGGTIPNPLVITDTLSSGHKFSPTAAVDLRILNSKQQPSPTENIRVGTTDPLQKALTGHAGHTVFDITREISADGHTMTITITPQAGGTWEPETHYQISYLTLPVHQGGKVDRGVVYSNNVKFTGFDSALSSRVFYVEAAGGSARMDPGFGSFSVVKLVDGPGVSSLPANSKVRVSAAWTLPPNTTAADFPGWVAPADNPLVLEVPVGGVTSYVPNGKPFPAGTVIELRELDAPAGSQIIWSNPRFRVGDATTSTATATLTIPGGQVTPVELTNEANVKKPSVSVGDYVWFDANKDGRQDATDVPLENVVLTIGRTDDLPVRTIDGTILTTTQTDAAGKYLFDNLEILPGREQYVVKVNAPAGYQPTKAEEGADRDLDSSTGNALAKELSDEDGKREDLSLDFGFVKSVPGIDIEKYDGDWAGVTFKDDEPELNNGQPKVLPAGDRDDADKALVVRSNQAQEVKFTVTNTGNAALNKVVVQDKSTAGPALTNLKCSINGADVAGVADANGVLVVSADPAWEFASQASFECTATMPALGAEKLHSNTASVEASPVAGGDKVTDSDNWHAKPRPKVSVGDYVWFDVNKDGLQDATDKPLKDVTLTISRSDNAPVNTADGVELAEKTTKTDAAGKYLFDNLEVLPKDVFYKVTVTTPAGYQPTEAGKGTDRGLDSSTDSATAQALPNNGDKDLSLDFGFVKSVPGIDIEKYDGDWAGVTFKDDEPELNNGQPKVLPAGDRDDADKALVVRSNQAQEVKFTVTNTGNAALNKVVVQDKSTAGPALTNLKCSINGADVAGVADANGVLVVSADPAWEFASQASFECTATMPALGAEKLHSNTASVEASPVAGGDKVTDSDNWHAKPRPKVSVGDYVWFDVNKDGLQDDSESGIADVELKLTGPDGKAVTNVFGAVVGPVKTDKDGKYVFADLPVLPAGKHYTVSVTTPMGYLATKEGKDNGSGAKDSSTKTSVSVADLSTDGAADPTLDFGFYKPSVSVGDYVFEDNNDNGIQDEGDKPIAGVELKLTGPDGKDVTDVNGQPVTPVKTGKDGKYVFPNLPVLDDGQSYTVTVTPPAGYEPAKAGQGNRENDSSTSQASSVGLTKDGQQDYTLDFGFKKPQPTTPPEGGKKGKKLSKTGSDALGIAPYAIALLAAGGSLLLFRRKKSH